MIVSDPNQIGITCRFYDLTRFADGLEIPELTIKFVDIFPARRRIEFANVPLNFLDGRPFERGNLLKTLL